MHRKDVFLLVSNPGKLVTASCSIRRPPEKKKMKGSFPNLPGTFSGLVLRKQACLQKQIKTLKMCNRSLYFCPGPGCSWTGWHSSPAAYDKPGTHTSSTLVLPGEPMQPRTLCPRCHLGLWRAQSVSCIAWTGS